MIHIVTDSTAQLTPEEIKENSITVVPLQVTLDGKTYRDNIDITRQQFSDHLAQDDEFPKTSQPSVGTFVEAYEKLAKPGDSIVSIHIGSVLSGTPQAAQMAADQVDVPVEVLDSGLTDRGLAFVVLQAAKLARTVNDAKAIVGQLTEYMKKITLTCFVNSLDYFAKGGRARRAIGFVSSIIKLKLELTMPNGKLDVAHKARGEKGMQKMIKGVVDDIIADHNVTQVGLSYVDSHEDTDAIAQTLKEQRPDLHILNRLTSPVIMTHVGPRGFAIIYV
ncbi:DegV family protein [Schleiferilactobacillus shenzhenensis]|uniref:DegV n=1 Tax=Schleiferilactobacillus shenzhenensis LY-73 TaxID=1231336 RepID=U4TJQ5_9LACO|nr:DegV family protein [Schleiferilactobacillus shenzhenensis]ERL65066.1 hypothetical protein L248_3004 [Schleiferilactobacillus shenzhenensis LY-73]